MPETRDIGRFYLHGIRLERGSALLHRAVTQEIDYPYRVGHSIILRFWREHGVVIGRWGAPAKDEDAAMRRALGAREENPFGRHGTLLERYRRAEQADHPEGEEQGTSLDPQALHGLGRRSDPDRDPRP